ncbi:hypothetical protein JNUCC0626_46995 [Lentzea sp. JNUCC 0626]|uniref:hypothetical protein n=1 Tax=Lentzea sp. JNUCC 0626 TaxID=3367513 RepID=UPI003747E90B
MDDRLPLTNAQLAFVLQSQRTGLRDTITLRFHAPASRLPAADVRQVLESIVRVNPALSQRIRFSRGEVFQQRMPVDCDFAELREETEHAVSVRAAEAIADFETDLDGPAMSARLIRSPNGDHLVLVFDHALVDEQSLVLVKRQLSAPAPADCGEWERYAAAVTDRVAFETAAGSGPGAGFWADRLAAAGDDFPEVRDKASRSGFVILPSVAIPGDLRGSLFPLVLFSLHRAVRDVAGSKTTSIGYPWGERNGAFADVMGCFMNTVVSLDTTTQAQGAGVAEFLQDWYREIDHADVPFTVLTGLGSAFTGAVTAMLSFTHAKTTSVTIAGTEAVQVLPSHDAVPSTAEFLAAAGVHGDELRLRLLLDETSDDRGAQDLGARWRHRLSETFARSSRPRR